MNSLADYGNSDSEDEETKSTSKSSSSNLFGNLPQPKRKHIDEEEEEHQHETQPAPTNSLFSALPPPKTSKSSSSSTTSDGKKKITFTVPINAQQLKEKKKNDDDNDSDDEKRPLKKPNTSGSGAPLSFLPAPRFHNSEGLNEVQAPSPASVTSVTVEKKKLTDISKMKTQPPAEKKVEDPVDTAQKEKKIEQQKAKSAQSQKAFRDLLNSATITVPQIKPKAPEPSYEPEVTAEYPPPEDIPQQYEDYQEPSHPGYEEQQIPPQQHAPAAIPIPADPNVARQFKDLYSGRANIVDINVHQSAASANNAPRFHEPLVEPMPAFSGDQYNYVIPTRDARRQHQVTYLVWEAKQKAMELEGKRATSARNRKETRNKYGW